MTAAVCADAHLAHEKLARKLGFIFKELVTSSGEHIKEGIFHLQHVTAYHSTLKGWLGGIFHGVCDKVPTLKIKRFIGRSENAVTIQMLTTMIAYLLLRLARITTPCKLSLQQIARRISLNLTSLCSQIELFSDPSEKTRVCLLQSPAHLELVYV